MPLYPIKDDPSSHGDQLVYKFGDTLHDINHMKHIPKLENDDNDVCDLIILF